ncbi:MAG: AmmeMemoRadiSam system protein A [Bacteroidota bacterium]
MLTPQERSELLTIARSAVAHTLHSEEPQLPALLGGALAERSGAFVTLRRGGDLRGCIGYIESELPLGQVVQEVAIKAAREDPRFPPVTEDELRELTFEISVLSPLRPVQNVEEIQVGQHGLLLELGWHRGLLLPQVAVEYGWDREQFLNHTARKAGLPPRAWEDPRATLYLFQAEVFDEEQTR